MDGSHRVVGVEGLIIFLVLLVANYFLIYLIVSHVMKNSRLNIEINNLKNELKSLRELLIEEPTDTSNKK